jgi:hypothetical protein
MDFEVLLCCAMRTEDRSHAKLSTDGDMGDDVSTYSTQESLQVNILSCTVFPGSSLFTGTSVTESSCRNVHGIAWLLVYRERKQF